MTVMACGVALAFAAGFAQAQAQPQSQPEAQAAATTFTVRKGDTLIGIARKIKPDGLSHYQMTMALWRANKDAFPDENINLLKIGVVLAVPSREAVAAVDARQAPKLVHELIDAHLLASNPRVASVEASTPVDAAKVPQGDALKRFRLGQGLERKGDHENALRAYLESGEAGYGPAQKRLAQIYDKGSPATPRDYETALLWYERARNQGVELLKAPRRTVPIN
jgi:FimV-like protein